MNTVFVRCTLKRNLAENVRIESRRKIEVQQIIVNYAQLRSRKRIHISWCVDPPGYFALDLATRLRPQRGRPLDKKSSFINAADFWTKDRTRSGYVGSRVQAEKGILRAWTLFVRELQERGAQSAGFSRPMTPSLMSGKARLLWASLLLRVYCLIRSSLPRSAA